ncbi:hypothetical protein MN202_04505 [Rheinheimera muenzenbergensis]|uniref:Uncharacterized protein n=1 Tax=Rheinheimera muenzenbergensis TaxID=1193628 RepID=A0ABU8C3J1_9GAMM
MKITTFDESTNKFINLDEVSISASVESLQGLVALIQAAIDKQAEQDHVHLRDYWQGWKDSDADVIIFVK